MCLSGSRMLINLIFILGTSQVIKACELGKNIEKSLEEYAADLPNLEELLMQMQAEKNFETFYVYGNASNKDLETSVAQVLQEKVQKPMVVQQTLKGAPSLNFNTKMRVIAYLSRDSIFEVTQGVAELLNNRREVNIIFIWKGASHEVNVTELGELFKHCDQHNMLNVLAIFRDFPHTRKLYAYRKFPEFVVEAIDFNSKATSFARRSLDLHGHDLRTLPDQVPPNTYVYQDKTGKWQVGGTMQKFMLLLAAKLNATVAQARPIVPGRTIMFNDFLKLASNDTIDVAQVFASVELENITQFSATALVYSMCLMLPVEGKQSFVDFFLDHWRLARTFGMFFLCLLMGNLLLWSQKSWCRRNGVKYTRGRLDQLLHPAVFAGLFGYPHRLDRFPTAITRLMCLLLFFMGLINSTLYAVVLSTFLTKPSPVHFMRSMDDVAAAKLPVMIHYAVAKHLHKSGNKLYNRYAHIFKNVDGHVWQQHFESFNTSYAYVTYSPRWFAVDAQQRLAARPLFRYSDICFSRFRLGSYILAPNSIYRPTVNKVIAAAREFGLLQYWNEIIFYDMVAAGKVDLTDISPVERKRILNMHDFYAVWIMWSVLLATSCIAFVFELFCHRLRVRKSVGIVAAT